MSQTQTRRSSQVDLLHGPILKSLLLFALPIMASRVFQQIYNTMDTLIVGYTLGDSSIAAMGACSSIYEMMTGFTFGVGNGLAIVTARCFGRQETDRMKKSVASCIVIGVAVTLVVTILATIFMHPLLRLLKTPAEILEASYPDERKVLCVGTFGNNESFFTMKGIANTIAESMDIEFTYEPVQKSFLHPYQAVKVLCEGTEIGYFGKAAYDIQNELSMRTSAYIMELDLKELSRWYGKKRTFQPISKFQEEKRDLAFVMDKNISCGDVENCIREANKYVKEIRLFDVYEGGQIPEGKKSMAFTVTFAPKEEAFDFEKVQKFVEKICKKLQNEFNIELRG